MKNSAQLSGQATLLVLSAAVWLAGTATAAETVWLDSLDLKSMRQSYGRPEVNHSVTGAALSIAGQHFERGVGTHANGIYRLNLAGGTEQFIASVGVDDDVTGPGSVVFQIIADGRKVFDSGIMRPKDAAKSVDLDLNNVGKLLLVVNDAGDGGQYDHADWAGARFIVTGQKPVPLLSPQEPFVILTPNQRTQ